jgi:branched-chain amino acid transport system permease protein
MIPVSIVDGISINIDGISINYVENGSGPVLLYIHGNTGSLLWFDRVMSIPGWRTIALDIPNFGRSGPLPGEISIDRYADAVASFIGALDVKRPVVVGHSLGGSVALSLAARYPELLRALVLVDSGPPSGLKTPVESHPAIEMMRTNPQVLAMALKAVVPTMSDEAWFAALVEEARLMAEPAWIGNAVALGKMDLRGRLVGFTRPVLVIHGGKDVIITAEMAEETRAAFPHARLVELPELGHSVIAEDPTRFKALLMDFLSSL